MLLLASPTLQHVLFKPDAGPYYTFQQRHGPRMPASYSLNDPLSGQRLLGKPLHGPRSYKRKLSSPVSLFKAPSRSITFINKFLTEWYRHAVLQAELEKLVDPADKEQQVSSRSSSGANKVIA